MEKQLNIFDWMVESAAPVPPIWECRESCRHFGEKVDYPDWWFGEGRCLLADTESTVVNNRYISWCKKYEPK